MFENRIKTLEQIEELMNVIFTGREVLNYEQFAVITSSEISDLLVNVSLTNLDARSNLRLSTLHLLILGKTETVLQKREENPEFSCKTSPWPRV